MKFAVYLAPLLGFIATSLAWDGWSTDDSDLVMGLNLGSYFIIEQWMMWQYVACNAPGVNDTWGFQSLPNVNTSMINHLDTYIREVDFQDAQSRGINFVRIPVAFWMFIPTEGDEPYWTDSRQKDVYLLQLVEWAAKYGMEVLIDLHALPGGQNTDEHSGRDLVTAGLAPQFLNSTNLLRGNQTVDAVIEWIQALPANLSSTIAMIELANEPALPTADSYELLVGYYVANQAKVAAKLPNVWTVIGDAWLGVQSWGDVFNPNQKVAMDLHWWNLFTDIPSLTVLEDTYCSLSPPTLANAWKNPVLVGEFSANENGVNFTSATTEVEQLQFYQALYASQLWAARGSGGRLPLYRGAFVWSAICTNCADVWQPYYVTGMSDTFAITAPNWCNKTQTTPTDPNQAKINPSPTHAYNSCGVYQDNAVVATGSSTGSSSGSSTAAASGTGAATTSAVKGAASRQHSADPSFVGFMLLLTIVPAVFGFCLQLG